MTQFLLRLPIDKEEETSYPRLSFDPDHRFAASAQVSMAFYPEAER